MFTGSLEGNRQRPGTVEYTNVWRTKGRQNEIEALTEGNGQKESPMRRHFCRRLQVHMMDLRMCLVDTSKVHRVNLARKDTSVSVIIPRTSLRDCQKQKQDMT